MLLTCCTGATQPLQIRRAAQVATNASPAETEAILSAVQDGLAEQLTNSETASRGGLRRAVLHSVEVDEPLAMVTGCGTFYDFAIPESYAITLTSVRNAHGWSLDSWQVDTNGLHGPPEACK
jgi:hypothetical protein